MRLRLDEDGIMLWLAALRNATTLKATTPGGPALFDLLPGAIELLASNLDLLGTILSIVEAYLLLDATSVLQVRRLTFGDSKIFLLRYHFRRHTACNCMARFWRASNKHSQQTKRNWYLHSVSWCKVPPPAHCGPK